MPAASAANDAGLGNNATPQVIGHVQLPNCDPQHATPIPQQALVWAAGIVWQWPPGKWTLATACMCPPVDAIEWDVADSGLTTRANSAIHASAQRRVERTL